ncbi:MAG: hypothetical protein ACYDIA_09555 [Candidatus Humimicrobiaceae bacterium]
MKKALIILAILALVLIVGSIMIGCSPESKYENEFLKSYNDYNDNVSKLTEIVNYNKENPNNAPEYFNDKWVMEAHKMYISEMIANIEKLKAPYQYQNFNTSIWTYYVYLYNYFDGEKGLNLQEAQGLFDLALSDKNPINNKVINKKSSIKENIKLNNTKKEIIKFDNEYWKITDDLTDKQKAWADEIDVMTANLEKDKNEGNLDKNAGSKSYLEWIRINEEEKKYYSEYISKFKNLVIPEPLQDFYYKKLEQCNVELERYNNWTETLNFILSEQQNMEQGQSSPSTENNKKSVEEGNNLLQKRSDLDLRCKQIIKDVYLEYNLDDLINKWQQ